MNLSNKSRRIIASVLAVFIILSMLVSIGLMGIH